MPEPCNEAGCLNLTLGSTAVGRVEPSHRICHSSGPATRQHVSRRLPQSYVVAHGRLFEVPFHPRRWLKDCFILNGREVFDLFAVQLNNVYSVVIILPFYCTVH